MTQDDINAIKGKAVPILKHAGVTRSSLFGSYVHGDQTIASDIDMLVDVPRGTSLFDLADLQVKLQEALGKDVDVVTFASLHPLLKTVFFQNKFRFYEKRRYYFSHAYS